MATMPTCITNKSDEWPVFLVVDATTFEHLATVRGYKCPINANRYACRVLNRPTENSFASVIAIDYRAPGVPQCYDLNA